MTIPSGIGQGYDLRGVNFSYSGPENHTILTLTRRNNLGGVDTLVVDPSQLNRQNQIAFVALCAQRSIQQSNENKKLLNEATDSLNECKRMIAELSGDNQERSSIARFFSNAASKIRDFFSGIFKYLRSLFCARNGN
jgi:urease accessory protein UreH